jgi:hypothetical protein
MKKYKWICACGVWMDAREPAFFYILDGSILIMGKPPTLREIEYLFPKLFFNLLFSFNQCKAAFSSAGHHRCVKLIKEVFIGYSTHGWTLKLFGWCDNWRAGIR